MYPHERVGRCYDGYQIDVLIEHNGVTGIYVGQKKGIYRIVKMALTPEGSAILRHELSLLEQLTHPNVVSLIESIIAEGLPALVLHRYTRGPLDRYIGQFSKSEIDIIFSELCEVCRFLHENGIVHRDIKPQNIVLDNLGKPALIDFGVACIEGTNEGFFVGTSDFAAPELLQGGKATPASDLYSVACVVYTLIHGDSPTKTTRILTEHGLPLKQEQKLNRMLDTNPDKRVINIPKPVEMAEEVESKPVFVSEKKYSKWVLFWGFCVICIIIAFIFDCF